MMTGASVHSEAVLMREIIVDGATVASVTSRRIQQAITVKVPQCLLHEENHQTFILQLLASIAQTSPSNLVNIHQDVVIAGHGAVITGNLQHESIGQQLFLEITPNEDLKAELEILSHAQQVLFKNVAELIEQIKTPIGPVVTSIFIPEIKYYVTTQHEAKLRQKLFDQSASIKYVAIYGIAGSGKTTLAEQYLQECQTTHPDNLMRVLLAETAEQWWNALRDWVGALYPRLNETLKTETDFVRRKKLIAEAIQQALSEKPWCVIIDNWGVNEDITISDIRALFSVGTGVCLITTQYHRPFPEESASLDLSMGLAPAEGYELLTKIFSSLGGRLFQLGSEEERQKLADTLNNLPLALVVAGSYILWENQERKERGEGVFTCHDYEQLLQEETQELIESHEELLAEKSDIPRESEVQHKEFKKVKTQEAAINLSLKKAIQPDAEEPNIELWQLLCFCGFLSSDGIPQQLLKDYLQQLNLKETEIKINRMFNNTLRAAQKYSLLQYEDKRSVVDNLFSLHIHRVVQKILREKYWKLLQEKMVTGENFENDLVNQMANTLNQKFDFYIRRQLFDQIREYLIHAKSWRAYRFNSINEIFFQNNHGWASYLLGNYVEAEAIYRQTLEKAKYYSSMEHIEVEVAKIQMRLANILLLFGKERSEIEAFYEQALNTVERFPANEEADKLAGAIQENHGSMFQIKGQYDKAEKLYNLALLKIRKYHPEEGYFEAARIYQNLANTLENQGKYFDAVSFLRRSLKEKIICFKGEDHLSVAIAQQNLSRILSRLGEYDEAEQFCQKALLTKMKHFKKEESTSVAIAQQTMAMILTKRGSKYYEESEELLRKALSTLIAGYNEGHIDVAITKIMLAEILSKQKKDLSIAKRLCEEAIITAEKHYENQNSVVLLEFHDIFSIVLVMSGENERAEAMCRNILIKKIEFYGVEHIQVAESKRNLGIILKLSGKNLAEIQRLYEEVIKIQHDFYKKEEHIEIEFTKKSFQYCSEKTENSTEVIDAAMMLASGSKQKIIQRDFTQSTIVNSVPVTSDSRVLVENITKSEIDAVKPPASNRYTLFAATGIVAVGAVVVWSLMKSK